MHNLMKMAAVATLGLSALPAAALAAPILGSDLASFAVLGATGVTNVATSAIGGNLGSAPTGSPIGDGSVTEGYVFSSGSLQPNTVLAQNAQLQLDAAILALNGFGPGTLIGADLTGTILPGVYSVPAAATNLSGALILDGLGSNTAVWVFLFESTLITSTTSTVTVQNVGDGAGVGLYWNVATAATLNGPTFAGNVLANTLISSDGDLTIACGRLLSATSQVTLIHDNISITDCGNASGGYDQAGDTGGGGGQTVPEPATFLLLGAGLAALSGFRKKSSAAA